MKKIIHIITDTNIGGAGRLLINYLHNFDKSKYDITVVMPKNAMLRPCVENEGYPVIETEHGADKSLDIAAIGEYMRIIKELKPDIVHTHSAFSAKLAAYLCHVPRRFYTRHCAFDMPKYLTTFPGKQINGFVNNTLATDIVAVAKAAADNLIDTGVDRRKITVIINGVEPVRKTTDEENAELRAKLGIPEASFVAGISARLEDYKGHMYLLDTAKTVLEAHPDTYFLIVGGGSMEKALKDRAKELGIEKNVVFTGFVDNVAPYYGIMNINLNCSWGTETSSLSLSEGMSVGLPAIVTEFGGNPYMVTDGVNGFVVPKKDSRSMAEAIIKLIEYPLILDRMKSGALNAYRTKFTAKAMTQQLEKLYDR